MSSSQHPAPTLNDLLELKGISKGDFSKTLDVSPSTPRTWRRGEATPSLAKAIAASKILGVSLKTFCHSINLNTDGIPDDSSDLQELQNLLQEERRKRAEDLLLMRELLASADAVISQIDDMKARLQERSMG